MSHQTFVNQWKWKFYREPWMSAWECVALWKLYAKEVQGITLPSFWGSALSGWRGTTYNEKYWKRVKNTPKIFPKQGDHVFFDIGIYGHVAICNTASVNNMTVIEQNRTWLPWDAKGDEISIGTYDYKHVLGWFTPLFKLPNEEVQQSVVEDVSNKIGMCPDLPPNPHKVIANYNQVVDGHCTIFAAFWALAYNTGKVFRNLRVKNTAVVHCNPQCSPLEAVNIICKEFWLKFCALRDEEAEKALSLGYALVISIIAPSEMIVDWIRDGVIDGTYNRDIRRSHALLEVKEGEYYLINSLGDYVKKGYYNKYRLTKEQLESIIKSQNKYLIY